MSSFRLNHGHRLQKKKYTAANRFKKSLKTMLGAFRRPCPWTRTTTWGWGWWCIPLRPASNHPFSGFERERTWWNVRSFHFCSFGNNARKGKRNRYLITIDTKVQLDIIWFRSVLVYALKVFAFVSSGMHDWSLCLFVVVQ